MRTWWTNFVLSFGLTASFGCGDRSPTGPAKLSALLSVSVTAAPAGVRTIRLEITGPGISTALVYSLDVVGGSASDTLVVPAGSNRQILANALDSAGANTHRGDTTVTLTPGLNPVLRLVLRPLNATLPIVITFGDSVVSVVVSPVGASTEVGARRSFRAIALSARGDTIPGAVFTWRVLNSNVAAVDSLSGAVSALSDGQVTISATANGATGYALLTVAMPGAAAVELWEPMSSGTSEHLARVWGVSSSEIYAVGNSGAIVRWDGTNWTAMTSWTTQALRGVWGTSGSEIIAVGKGGTVVRYNGTTWTAMASGTTQGLRTVWGTSGSDIFVVGDAGTILRYNGTSWTAMTSGTTVHLNGVWGTSGSDVFAVGEGGTILQYNGSVWSAMTSGTTQHLTSLWGRSVSDIYAVGEGGTILHYNGSSWTAMTGGTSQHLNGLWGSSASDIYVSGANGTLLRHDGTSWTAMTSGITQWLHAVWGTGSGDVFAVGLGSTVLRGHRGAE